VVRYHKHKEINCAIGEAIKLGWTVQDGGHAVLLHCPCPPRLGMRISVSGTPPNPEGEASRVRRMVKYCPDRHALDKRPKLRNG
jgi:hypothetical protein